MRSAMFTPLAPIMLLIAVLFHLVPRMRKRNLYFAVTVPEEFRQSEEGRAIARAFRTLVWAGTIVALAVSWFALGRGWMLLATLAPDVQIVVVLIAWVLAWRRTRHHAAEPGGVRSADLFAQPERAPGGPLATILPFLGPLGAAAWLWFKYTELPARYPVHWNASGHVDHYVAKSPMAVFLASLISAAVLLLMFLIALGIRFATRRGSSGEQPGWASKFRQLNLGMLTAVMWLVSLLTTVGAVAPLLPASAMGWLPWVIVVVLLLTVAGFAVPMIRMGMERTGGTDATPDECWKGGLIHYNPADTALMVERRDGVGFTINFGNRLSWWVIGLMLLAIGPLMLSLGLK